MASFLTRRIAQASRTTSPALASLSTSRAATLASSARTISISSLGSRSSLSVSRASRSSVSTSSRRSASTAEAEVEETAEQEPVWPVRILPEMTPADIKFSSRQRNVGISAHIDSGKTTLTERVLFYTGKIEGIHEVRGKDGAGAKMDSMDLEREKGITIQSAATFCDWAAVPPEKVGTDADGAGEDRGREKFNINIIDTPGHVDFTIEVERALRVLDGAVLVLCAVSGVQSQTITVDRQMRRYDVPRISFINKMDRQGANPWKVIDQIRHKLRKPAAAVQIPIGNYENFIGVVDLIRMRAYYNEGVKGLIVREADIPAELVDEANAKRAELIEQLAEVDESISDAFLLEMPISTTDIVAAIRRCTINNSFSPVFLGSAIKNTGIQALLDGVVAYLPDPSEVPAQALDVALPTNAPPVPLVPAADANLVGLAFKLEEGKFGQLTYMRIYQGTLRKGGFIFNARTGKKMKVPRLVRMHSADMEEVDSVGSGEICAMFGVDCSSGDTFTDGKTTFSMTSMFVPEPVVSLALVPLGKETPQFSKGLNRFGKEDPTFRVHVDKESKETIISGMGELHLEIYVERLKREYGVECKTGKPQVAFKETITQRAKFDFTHKKQTGGSGQFGKVKGFLEPMEFDPETGSDVAFESRIMAGTIPAAYIPSIEKGFREALKKGPLNGSIVTGVRYVLEDGGFHAVDSSELAFITTAIGSVREAFKNAKPVILEPIMRVEVIAPTEFQGNVIGNLNQRRGTINDTETRDEEFTAVVDVSLNDMFGYSAALRGMTQGKGEFSMEYKEHIAVPSSVQKTMEEAYQKELQAKRDAKK